MFSKKLFHLIVGEYVGIFFNKLNLFHPIVQKLNVTVANVIPTVVPEIAVIQKLIKIFFHFGFGSLSGILIHNDKIFFKSVLLKCIVLVDLSNCPACSSC